MNTNDKKNYKILIDPIKIKIIIKVIIKKITIKIITKKNNIISTIDISINNLFK